MITGKPPFILDAPSDMTFSGVHIVRMCELLGNGTGDGVFAKAFLDQCDPAQVKILFDDKGYINSRCIHYPDSFYLKGHLSAFPELTRQGALRERLQKDGELSGPELDLTESFLRRCLSTEPSSRATVDELLQDDWIQG